MKRRRRSLRYPKNWRLFSRAVRRIIYYCQVCHRAASPKVITTLHHINGNTFDNRPVNLLIVCRECHLLVQSQNLGIDPATIIFNSNHLRKVCSDFGHGVVPSKQ